MEKKISIIIPIYNMEQYLEKCLDTVLEQTYSNLEIILINDGSKDNSGKICDEYKNKDSRIVVIHKENGGVSEARNVGIQSATGDYIGFIDPDDLVEKNMFEVLLSTAVSNDADLSMCGFKQIDEDNQETDVYRESEEPRIIGRKEAQLKYFEGYDKAVIYTVPWNKLYRRDLIKGHSFKKGIRHEDEIWSTQLLYDAKKIAYTPELLYRYRCRKESMMGQFHANRFHLFDAYLFKMRFFEKKQEWELWNRYFSIYMRMFAQYMKWQKESGKAELKKNLKEYHKKLQKEYKKTSAVISKGKKMEYMLFSGFLPVYYLMWSLKKR